MNDLKTITINGVTYDVTPGSHGESRENPHDVTAEQVGAKPNTWMPTAEEVGARPNTWTPTASEVGAAPTGYGLGTSGQLTNDWNTAMLSGFYYGKTNSPDGGWWAGVVYAEGSGYAFQHLYKNASTAQKVRECNNGTWGAWVDVSPSAFAPSGYGLGDRGITATNADSMVKCGWFRTTTSTENTDVFHGAGVTLAYDDNRVLQILGRTTNGRLLSRFTPNADGVFVEEAINPYYELGKEYRTIERWNGKTVYTKLIDFGALPNNTTKTVSANTKATAVIDAYGYAHNPTERNFMPLSGQRIRLWASVSDSGSSVSIATDRDMSAFNTTYVVIKYTKD